MMNFKAIILDMDGTLVNTERLWKQAEKDMLAAHGCTYNPETHKEFLGMAVREFIDAVREAYGLMDVSSEQLITELNTRVKAILMTDTLPTTGAEVFVQHIVDSGIPCAIASNSSHEIIEFTLKNQRWLDGIPMRYSSDDVPHAKPAPDLYLHVAELLGVAPQECLTVEDSLTGVRSATAAGMTCYAVPDFELADVEAYRQITPHIFESLVDVLEHLR
jgi:HAD superfamily hydrolase (TIGR01509 family)